MGRPVIQPWCGARNAGSQNGWKSSLERARKLCFVTLIITSELHVSTEDLELRPWLVINYQLNTGYIKVCKCTRAALAKYRDQTTCTAAATQPITRGALYKYLHCQYICWPHCDLSWNTSPIENSLMINKCLVFNDCGIEVYVMAKLIRVLRNLSLYSYMYLSSTGTFRVLRVSAYGTGREQAEMRLSVG